MVLLFIVTIIAGAAMVLFTTLISIIISSNIIRIYVQIINSLAHQGECNSTMIITTLACCL